jgi:hypothetical protein
MRISLRWVNLQSLVNQGKTPFVKIASFSALLSKKDSYADTQRFHPVTQGGYFTDARNEDVPALHLVTSARPG